MCCSQEGKFILEKANILKVGCLGRRGGSMQLHCAVKRSRVEETMLALAVLHASCTNTSCSCCAGHNMVHATSCVELLSNSLCFSG